MRLRRRPSRPPPGEYPPSFTHAWLRQTLPSISPAEARAVLRRLRSRGWTEEELAERILPYMPRPGASQPARLPRRVTTAWLDRQLPAMDAGEIRQIVDELERRGWRAAELALAVLPHLLPKLGEADADAVLAGLKELGLTEEEVGRLSPRGSAA